MREKASTALAFDRIRERILFAGDHGKDVQGAPVVVFMSRTRGEGVTTVAAGVAKAFGRAGQQKVLVVNADDRRGGVGRLLGVTHRVRETTEPEAPRGSLPDSIQRLDKHGIDILTLGTDQSTPLAYDGSWQTVLAQLRSTYDLMLVDAGSLQTQTPLTWSRWATQLLLVVDTNRTTVEALERLKKDLQHFPLVLTGVILNKRRYPVPQFVYRWLS